MAPFRVLIVEDQRAVREVLKEGLLSLDADFEVLAVPSAEEALLEEAGRPVDLLVADVHLPGMSGLELLQRLRARQPEMKVILITGVTDPEVRRKVADAGADAFFLKPVELADFLDVVERIFGLVETLAPEQGASAEAEAPRASVAEYLVTLRRELNGISVVLLDEGGHVVVQAGDLPDAIVQSPLLSRLMAAFSLSEQISRLLKQSHPQDVLAFGGQKYDLFFSHVGHHYALLVVTNRPPDDPLDGYFGRMGAHLQAAVSHLERVLDHMGVPVRHHAGEGEETPDEETPLAGEEADEPLDEALSSLLENAQSHVDPDAFWETLVTSADSLEGDLLGADVLSYDQARQLGLAPSDEEEEAR